MLHEYKAVSQKRGDPGKRRLFWDEHMDLFVWYTASGGIYGFQLIYDKNAKSRAFTWLGKSLQHAAIDWGDASGGLSKGSPILIADGQPPYARVLSEFNRRSKQLEPAIRNLVLRTIAGWAGHR